MILQRTAAAIRARDWVAVAIEFAIVVLGIFVALQAQNWNQVRQDRQLEQVYLARLAEETRANLEMIQQMERIFEGKVQFILALPQIPLEETFRHDPQAFMQQLDDSAWVAIPDLRSETYAELESSGRLALLRDARLRAAIATNLNNYRSFQPVAAHPLGDYRRILFETLPGHIYHDFRIGSGTTEIDVDAVIATVDAFRKDPRFAAAANAEVFYGADILYWLRIFRQRTEDILEMLVAVEGQV